MRKNNLIFTSVVVSVALVFACFYSIWDKTKTVAASSVSNQKVTVVIDAGHGGFDGGTTGADGAIEKDINLLIAQKVYQNLRLMGINAVMTRKDDSTTADDNIKTIKERKTSDLTNRMKFVNDTPNSVLVSIHQNHYSESKYSGLQVFYSPNGSESEMLASLIQDNVRNNLQPENTRQIKKAESNLFLLHKAKVPSVLVECGFMSNEAENMMLQDVYYQNKLAFSIAVSINDFINYRSIGG